MLCYLTTLFSTSANPTFTNFYNNIFITGQCLFCKNLFLSFSAIKNVIVIDSKLEFPFHYLYNACEQHLTQRVAEKNQEAYVETVMKWGKVSIYISNNKST